MSAHQSPDKRFSSDRGQDPEQADPEFEALLEYLKHDRGCDLTGYKRSSLVRRFQHRMQTINLKTYQHYLYYLQTHSTEYLELLNDVLINVTDFFRDRDAWEYLAVEIIPKIIAKKAPNEPIRVWSAGCSKGQEIYSLLILFAEALGLETCLERVHCFATDADEAALRQARQGIYTKEELLGVPPELQEKYFQQTDQGYVFHSKLRRTIVFAPHDLIQNSPLSKIDLLVCRNVLIYFNPETQTAILNRFHFALKSTGFLFLGKAETFSNPRQIFTPVSLNHRIYTKGLKLGLNDFLSINPKSWRRHPMSATHNSKAIDPLAAQSHFWQAAFETSPIAQFAVDLKGCLISANEQANRWFGLTLEDWHRPFQDLEPGMLVAVHATIKTFYHTHHSQTLRNIAWSTANSVRYFDIKIAPVFTPQQHLLGTIVTFQDVTDSKQLAAKLAQTDSALDQVTKILQATESERDTTQKELESAYQEIQLLIQDTSDRN